MLKTKVTTTILALLCVCSMAIAALAPVAAANVQNPVEVACDGGFFWESF